MPHPYVHLFIVVLELLGIFIFFVLAIAFLMDRIIRSDGYQGSVSDHFDGKKFVNIQDGTSANSSVGITKILKWMLSRPRKKWFVGKVEQTKPQERVEGDALVVTFINHATTLIQTEGLNILTDPIYAERASPFKGIGPKRYAIPGVAYEHLPKIDAILISHNHYDHLDLDTLQRLWKRDRPKIFVPLGNSSLLAKHSLPEAIELDWWQSHLLSSEITISSVPAHHFSARALSDRNTTGWCGYVISSPKDDVYFAGDTGFGPFVEQIAAKYPKGFRLGLLPIGAYLPRWFMSPVHISPDEAVKMKSMLGIHTAVAIHFGTFNLADDGQFEPIEDLKKNTADTVDAPNFLVLKNGESLTVE